MVVGCLKLIIMQSVFCPHEWLTIIILETRKTITQMAAKKSSNIIDEEKDTGISARYNDIKRKQAREEV